MTWGGGRSEIHKQLVVYKCTSKINTLEQKRHERMNNEKLTNKLLNEYNNNYTDGYKNERIDDLKGNR